VFATRGPAEFVGTPIESLADLGAEAAHSEGALVAADQPTSGLDRLAG